MVELLTPLDIFSDKLCLSQPLATRILQSALKRDRLQQAYLLTGRSIDDKWRLVISLTSYLNCQRLRENDNRACPSLVGLSHDTWCLNCRWLADKKHPQSLHVLTTTDSKSGKIAVERARELSQELAKSSQYYRAAVIENADQDIFHRPAANALLKTIEEPKSTCIFFLFALTADNVLPTIVSRCQVIHLNSSNVEESIFSLKPLTNKPGDWDEEQVLLLNQACSELRTSMTTTPYLASVAFAERLSELLEGDVAFDNIIDLVLTLEAKSLKESQFGKLKITLYAKRLLDLCQLTKLQVRHYVSKRSAVESFAFSVKQLQMEFGIDE
jgi:DNA polymerase III, delta subunit